MIQGVDSEEVAKYMDKFNIGCRFGHFYAFRLMNALEIGEHGKKAASLGGNGKGVIRVSMVHYNTVEEVKLFIKHLDEVRILKNSKYFFLLKPFSFFFSFFNYLKEANINI